MMICIWPDGAWCEHGEALRDMSHRSDDFEVHEVPDEVDDICAWAAKQVGA